MYTKEEAREKIKQLTESFGEKLDFIVTSGTYKEAQIEDEFTRPLFKYLNWNISNEGITNAADREFIVQTKGLPDYLLQLNNPPIEITVNLKSEDEDLLKLSQIDGKKNFSSK